MKETKIKVCGLTTVEDALLINKYKIEYAGLILFYEKSKRYNTIQNTWNILRHLDKSVKKVAVTVSPTKEQIEMIEHMEFDFVQIHGAMELEAVKNCRIPIFRAYNIQKGLLPAEEDNGEKIAGYVLDSKNPGSGEIFDWKAMREFERKNHLLILAGGLHADNVQEGIRELAPDIVDVSSGVEGEQGKSEEKIKQFVRKVREYER